MKLNNQDLFNTVARHLLRQGKRAGAYIEATDPTRSPTFVCQYRAPDGCQCAAGAILPDDQYSPQMEGATIYGDLCRGVFEKLVETLQLLGELQTVHDYTVNRHPADAILGPIDEKNPNWLAVWRNRLEYVANRWDLNVSVLGASITV